MSQTQAAEVEQIKSMIGKVDSGAALSREEHEKILDVLQEHECWGPFFRLVKRGLQNPSDRAVPDYIRLARVQGLHLEDVFAAAETCAALVTHTKLSYKVFTEEILPQVILSEDYSAEAAILSAVCDRFSVKADHVACLERLCMLYEKKIHNEALLTKTYEKLLSADPRNVKALRYFKLVFTQSGEWEEVVGILKVMLECVRHPQETFRVAQELAAVYLYQLDMAEEAIAVLDSHCSESPLDTSTIHYDAYQRLNNWRGCLKVLRQCLLNVDEDYERAILQFKIGTIHEQLEEFDAAVENYVKAVQLSPGFSDAVEGIINIAVMRRDWPMVLTWLSNLAKSTTDQRIIGQIEQAQRRLQDGMQHAAARGI